MCLCDLCLAISTMCYVCCRFITQSLASHDRSGDGHIDKVTITSMILLYLGIFVILLSHTMATLVDPMRTVVSTAIATV